ncbi:hypothetical protein [Streptomyces sp. NPDC053079]|uniref:hypothetical protein n=1 Tax=Streptomyces sp. NPDC053079 TaxID=3365697 RepID=UPI0037D37088
METSPIHRSDQWLAGVRQRGASAHSGAQGAIRQACADYEAVWRALGEELDLDGDRKAFPKALARLREPRPTPLGLVAA